jgi:hypothetical protein
MGGCPNRPFYCVPFPHPQARKNNHRDENESCGERSSRDFSNRAIDIAEDRYAQHYVQPSVGGANGSGIHINNDS